MNRILLDLNNGFKINTQYIDDNPYNYTIVMMDRIYRVLHNKNKMSFKTSTFDKYNPSKR